MLESELGRWGRLDGALHAIAYAPRTSFGSVMGVPVEASETTWIAQLQRRLKRRLLSGAAECRAWLRAGGARRCCGAARRGGAAVDWG